MLNQTQSPLWRTTVSWDRYHAEEEAQREAEALETVYSVIETYLAAGKNAKESLIIIVGRKLSKKTIQVFLR